MNTSAFFRLLLLVIFSLNTSVFQSQVIEPNNNKTSLDLYDFYTLKQKKNNIAAWICLGGGVAMTITGMILIQNNTVGAFTSLFSNKKNGSDEGFVAGEILFVLGGATTLTSIPLFISAGKNNRKAKLELKKIQTKISDLNGDMSDYLCLSVTLNF